MTTPIHVSSVVRALGTAHAVAVRPDGKARLAVAIGVVGGTDAVARRIDPPGLTLLQVVLDRDGTWTPLQHLGAEVLPAAAWTAVNLLLGRALRRLPVPDLALGLVTGAGVAVLNAQLGERLTALRERLRQQAEERT